MAPDALHKLQLNKKLMLRRILKITAVIVVLIGLFILRTVWKSGSFKTIENRFRFSNAVFRAGFAQDFPFEGPSGISLRVGLAAHTINYTLVQRDNVQLTDRTLNAGWVEWTPTWGISLRFSAWELHYRGSVSGTEIFRLGGDDVTVTEPSGGGNILAAARGPLNMTGLRVIAHQFSISGPIH